MQKAFTTEDRNVLADFGDYFKALPGYTVEETDQSVAVTHNDRFLGLKWQQSGELKATFRVAGELAGTTARIRRIWITETISGKRLSVSLGYTTYSI